MAGLPDGGFPRHVARGLYTLRRLVQPATREAYDFYRSGMQARRDNLARTAADREAWVLRELQRAVRRAATIPFWRARFDAAALRWQEAFTFDDFARVPPLERAEIAAAGDALLRAQVPEAQRRKMATGGSSGTPTVTWTGPEERGWGESAAAFYEAQIGVRPGMRLAYLWGHHLDPIQRASTRDRLEDWLFNRRWYDCFRLSPERLAGYHESLQTFRPNVLIAYASALASLAEAIRDQQLSVPKYPTHAFLTGAEKLYPAQRALIGEVFGRPVYERYGGRDIGMIAVQLDASSTAYDVDWSNVLVERESVAQESSLLVTKLHADAMPMFRYRSGDIGRFPASLVGHGPAFRIEEVVGREMQRIWKPDGTWMHATVVPHLLKDFDLAEYQLRQHANYDVELLVVARDGFDASQEGAVRQALAMNLSGLPFEIRRVTAVPRTAAGKWLPVVSDVTRA